MGEESLAPDQIDVLEADAASALITRSVIQRFHEAFDAHDGAAMDALVAEDCTIENTTPAPDGALLVGKAACLANWANIANNRNAWFVREEVVVVGERAIVRWRYCWGDTASQSIRGVNIMRVRNGRIVEGLGYVKG